MNRNPIFRRTAPVVAALALGAGAGAGVYAGVTSGGGNSGSAAPATTVVASVPAQSTAARTAPAAALTKIYEQASDGVVDIRVRTSSADGFGGVQQGQAEGSGFVWDGQGRIVTNAHVVAGGTSIQVRFEDGTVAKAALVGRDEGTDIAVLDVDVPAAKLDPLPLGSSAGLLPGQSVVALGSPFGLPGTMTAGIISAVDRTITAPNNYSIAGAIQTDAAINQGNSGGPLLDATGRVIGVNAQIESNSNDNAGIGFAIPIDAVRDVTNTIIAGKTPQHAYLGVQIGDAQTGVGAIISRVEPDSPALKAGLQAGDVVTAIGGKAITGADDLSARVSTFKPGDRTTVTYRRNGSTKTADVTFTQRPS